jgi:hypothetical protein
MGGGSFAGRTLAETEQQGGQSIAQIPSQATSQFIGMAPGVINTGEGALATAGGLDTNQTYTPSFWQLFSQGLGSGASLGRTAAGGP